MKKSKPKDKDEAAKKKRGGLPVIDIPVPPHRFLGQPVGINYEVDRSKYDPNFHPNDFVKLCQEGISPSEIASAWGISEQELSIWCHDKAEMIKVYPIGATAQKAWYERHVREAMLGTRKANGLLTIVSTKNKMGWTDDGRTDFDDIGNVDVEFNFEES